MNRCHYQHYLVEIIFVRTNFLFAISFLHEFSQNSLLHILMLSQSETNHINCNSPFVCKKRSDEAFYSSS